MLNFNFILKNKKKSLVRRRFDTVKDIKAESQKVFYAIRDEDFQRTFEAWRWDRYINAKLLEGDRRQIKIR